MITLYNYLQKNKRIGASIPIKLPVVAKANIYGFVVYNSDIHTVFSDTVYCPPLGSAYVLGNRIVFSMENKIYRFPIFTKVSVTTKKKYPLYRLYVPRILNLKSNILVQAYKSYMMDKFRNFNLAKISKVQMIDDAAYYLPEDDEFIFESSSDLNGIGNAFVVITRRLSRDTGVAVYEVFNPDEIEVIE